MKVCEFEGCGNKVRARGWCTSHYNRWKKYGDPGWVSDREGQKSRGVWKCLQCSRELPLACFNKNGANSFQPRCIRCEADKRLSDKYGLSKDSWDALFERQGGCCAICKAIEPGGRGWWHTDHDHDCCPGENTCGRCVRAIICNQCNLAIGYVERHTNFADVLKYVANPPTVLCDIDYGAAAAFYGWDDAPVRHLRVV